ncbi:MAG: hypothetical protein KDC98_09745 [Planctomycetes bacterium]|nr:hypothetical protein [Planctomycetota bacterium]
MPHLASPPFGTRAFVAVARTVGAFAVGLVPAAATAQLPPHWADLTVPTGVVVSQLSNQGKLITYRNGSTLSVFSAVTRTWHTLAIGPGATLSLRNDCLLIQDGTQWTAYSAYTGDAATLTVSATAQLRNPGGQRNDSILLVADGALLHAYSAFVGDWTQRALQPGHDLGVQRHVAVLSMGTILSGFDAYTGQWHDMTVPATTLTISCDGAAGFAIDATTAYAFSALHRSWQTHAIPAAATFTRADDWGLFYDGNQMVAYSAVQGRFETTPYGATAVPHSADLVCLIDTPLGLVAFSAPRGVFSMPLGPSTATALISTAVLLLQDGLQITGYSPVHDSAATITLATSTMAVANVVAAVTESGTGRPWCFSALTGSWQPAPLDALPVPPTLTTTSALLQTTAGACAFSARTGNYISLASPAPTLFGNDQSAIAMVFDNTSLHAFDARADTWRSIARTSQATPIVSIWRTSSFVVDGPQQAHAFGAFDGVWSSVALPEPYIQGSSNSECSHIVTATHLLGSGPVPSLLAYAQFPEFRRTQPIGTVASMSLHLDGGGIALIAGGYFAATPTAVPGLGEFWLQQPLATVPVSSMPSHPRAVFDLAIPSAPSLVGLQLAFQALAIPANGSPGLGEATGLYIL